MSYAFETQQRVARLLENIEFFHAASFAYRQNKQFSAADQASYQAKWVAPTLDEIFQPQPTRPVRLQGKRGP